VVYNCGPDRAVLACSSSREAVKELMFNQVTIIRLKAARGEQVRAIRYR
jgi:hypothetical protein